jgi:hypothetical protein
MLIDLTFDVSHLLVDVDNNAKIGLASQNQSERVSTSLRMPLGKFTFEGVHT